MSTQLPIFSTTPLFQEDQLVKLVPNIVNDANEQPGYLYYEDADGEEQCDLDRGVITCVPADECEFRVLLVREVPSRTSRLIWLSHEYRLVKSTEEVVRRRVVPTSTTTTFRVSHDFLRVEKGGSHNTEIFKIGAVAYTSEVLDAPIKGTKPEQTVRVKRNQMVEIMVDAFTRRTHRSTDVTSYAHYYCRCVKEVEVYYYWKSARNVRETQIQAV